MAQLPENPVVGETVLEEFEYFDVDNDAYFAARAETNGSADPNDFLVSYGMKTNVYFWNGLCWLQWVHGDNPVNVYVEE